MNQYDNGTRINKYLAQSGFCSRREGDDLVSRGKIFINNHPAKMGDVVKDHDVVTIDRKRVIKAKVSNNYTYILLNKPSGILCTTDTTIKNNIIDYIKFKKRIFPVGRLDQMSEGLIILTDDGDIVNKLLKSERNHEKEYIVTIDKPMDDDFIQKMSNGVKIFGKKTKPCKVIKQNNYEFNIILTQGLNRQIRRMCEELGYFVRTLKRVRILDLEIKGMDRGEWRFLTQGEVTKLKREVNK